MRSFIYRLLQFLITIVAIVVLLLAGYVVFDPFKVLYKYEDYSFSRIYYNRDYVSTEMFLKNKERYQYNSYIFGSSRTIAFKPSSWKRFLNEKDNPFLFDASAETLFGIYRKLLFLDSINARIDNAFILICRDATFADVDNPDSHLYIKHPLVSGSSRIKFYFTFLNAYFDPKFLIAYYTYLITHRITPFMEVYLDKRNIWQDPVTNDIKLLDIDSEIALNEDSYYKKRQIIFFDRQSYKTVVTDCIKDRHLFMLKEIHRILTRHNTKYRVVVSPLYDQVPLSKNDHNKFLELFGSNFYDFSGKNMFTDSIRNYYESSHYRPEVGNNIFGIVYGKHLVNRVSF